jgi:hypothetical protein
MAVIRMPIKMTFGIRSLSKMTWLTFSRVTLSRMTLSTVTLRQMTLGRMTLTTVTLWQMTLGRMTPLLSKLSKVFILFNRILPKANNGA